MRSWDKYCEDTRKALEHFRDCIQQPVYIGGYITDKGAYLSQCNYLLQSYFGQTVYVEVLPTKMVLGKNKDFRDDVYNRRYNNSLLVALRGMQRDSVVAYTEMDDCYNVIDACGMRKPINRLGNAFSWPNVKYILLESANECLYIQ